MIYIYTYIHNICTHKHPGGIFTVRIFITKLSFRHSETSILTEKRGLRTWGFNFSIDNHVSVFSSSRGPKSNQDSCFMNVAVVFNNSRGFSHRHWNDLTYRNIFRFTVMEPFVVGILCGSWRRTGSGVATRMCVSANERYCPTPPHPIKIYAFCWTVKIPSA